MKIYCQKKEYGKNWCKDCIMLLFCYQEEKNKYKILHVKIKQSFLKRSYHEKHKHFLISYKFKLSWLLIDSDGSYP